MTGAGACHGWSLTVAYGDAVGRYADANRAVRRLLTLRYGPWCPHPDVQARDGLVTYHGIVAPAGVAERAARDVATVWTAMTGVECRCALHRDVAHDWTEGNG